MELFAKSNVCKYVAVLLLSHTTGFSFDTTINMFRRFGAVSLSPDRVFWLPKNMLAYFINGRTDCGDHWNSRRDHTQNFSDFEQTSFKQTRCVFLYNSRVFVDLYDDVFGTRASGKQ